MTQHQGDLADADGCLRARQPAATSCFTSRPRPASGAATRDYYRTNVAGTAMSWPPAAITASRRLVYTSSPSVVFDGRDMEGVDESVPYPAHLRGRLSANQGDAPSAWSCRANGADLATVALRPHLIWGPGDNHLIPRILARARAGRLRRIGTESKLIDSIYIDNAADAHLLAADRLAPGSPIAGQGVLHLSGRAGAVVGPRQSHPRTPPDCRPVTRSIPPGLAYAIGWFAGDRSMRLFRRHDEPPMTRFVARELTTAHWFDIRAARRDLGYEPKVSLDEGLRRLRQSLTVSDRRDR